MFLHSSSILVLMSPHKVMDILLNLLTVFEIQDFLLGFISLLILYHNSVILLFCFIFPVVLSFCRLYIVMGTSLVMAPH